MSIKRKKVKPIDATRLLNKRYLHKVNNKRMLKKNVNTNFVNFKG